MLSVISQISSWAAIVLAMASGLLWLRAARAEGPPRTGKGFASANTMGGVATANWFKRQGKLNSMAAMATAAAAFLQAIAMLAEKF